MTRPALGRIVPAVVRRGRLFGLCAVLSLLVGAAPPRAADDVALERIAGGFTTPVYVIGDPSDVSRLFVVELGGKITLLIDGVPQGKAFLNISSRVAVSTNGDEEYGLFSMAFHPKWPKKRFVFVMYTNLAGDTVVARFSVNKKRTLATGGSEKQMLKVVQPRSWHNGGQIQVGPDKHMYVGLGDGGDDADSGATGQDLTTVLGKLLRFKIANKKLKVPKSNPVLPGVGRTSIWAVGLRNPWRFSFDRETGDLLLGDVGEDSREEVDFAEAGSAGGMNYGWPVREGTAAYNGGILPATDPLTDPIFEYDHGEGQSITGGYVYRGSAIPDLVGYYVFGDWARSRIWAFELKNGKPKGLMELSGALLNDDGDTPMVSSFGEDANGELYVCDFFEGVIYRIVPAN